MTTDDTRRVPVQGDGPWHLRSDHPARRGKTIHPPGTIAWSEHAEAHAAYEARYGRGYQSAERLAERGGFSRAEAEELLGRQLRTWRKKGAE